MAGGQIDKDTAGERRRRLNPVLRGGEKVRFLELFFDLVFVLAFTQCTTLMVHQPTWSGLGRGLFVLALLWWAWAGFAWLTSTVDPEEGSVRIVMFGAMAALLVVGLAVPQAFGDHGLLFALAYATVRGAHLALFALAGRDDPGLRHSVFTLAVSSAIGVGLLTLASFLDGAQQAACWGLAILIDFGGPAIFGVEGWKLVPAHFAERHGLIIILALGESIVVLGLGSEAGLTAMRLTAAVLGVVLASALWWIYFDLTSLLTERRLTEAPEGRGRNALARDSYSYLHFPMAAGIVLLAVGLENTLAHVEDPLGTVPAFALLGGVAVYLLAHLILQVRSTRSLTPHRLVLVALLFALVPVAAEIPSLQTLGGVTVLLWAVVAWETTMSRELRTQLRGTG